MTDGSNLDEPYAIFRRQGSANYWMRFSLPEQGQIRISLGTSDAGEAKRLAQKRYQKAVWEAEHSLLPGRMSFHRVAKDFLASIAPTADSTPKEVSTYKAHRSVIERYFVPYFGNTTLASLTEPKLYAYLDWRQSYWTTGPGKEVQRIDYERHGRRLSRAAIHKEPTAATLRREMVSLRAVFRFAARKGYVKRDAIPNLEVGREIRNKRPSFTNAELTELLALAEQRLMQVPSSSKPHYERYVLYAFIKIAVETGMRPTELFNLSWDNIIGFRAELRKSTEAGRIRIRAYGKGKQPQELVPNIGALDGFWLLWDGFVTVHQREPRPAEPVFCAYDGQRLQSVKNALNALLEAAGLKRDAFGRARSAYSFRHTYASNQLRKGTDVYALAINMRTSVRMIEMYYSDVVPDDVAKQLEGSFG